MFALAAVLLFAAACEGDTVESKYSNYRASFTFSPVTSVAPLYGALNGFGEYCAIWADANYYHFSSLVGSAQVNKTALAVYTTFISLGGGFIVGRSSLSDIGSAEYPLVCYDRICPNCYRNDYYKAMRIEENGCCVCDRCRRTYDMNNGGTIVEGDKGRKLIRYRMTYASNTLAINN